MCFRDCLYNIIAQFVFKYDQSPILKDPHVEDDEFYSSVPQEDEVVNSITIINRIAKGRFGFQTVESFESGERPLPTLDGKLLSNHLFEPGDSLIMLEEGSTIEVNNIDENFIQFKYTHDETQCTFYADLRYPMASKDKKFHYLPILLRLPAKNDGSFQAAYDDFRSTHPNYNILHAAYNDHATIILARRKENLFCEFFWCAPGGRKVENVSNEIPPEETKISKKDIGLFFKIETINNKCCYFINNERADAIYPSQKVPSTQYKV